MSSYIRKVWGNLFEATQHFDKETGLRAGAVLTLLAQACLQKSHSFPAIALLFESTFMPLLWRKPFCTPCLHSWKEAWITLWVPISPWASLKYVHKYGTIIWHHIANACKPIGWSTFTGYGCWRVGFVWFCSMHTCKGESSGCKGLPNIMSKV